jgi:hypothetical protein
MAEFGSEEWMKENDMTNFDAPVCTVEEAGQTYTTEREVTESLNPDGSITVTTVTTVGSADGPTETTEEATYESVEAYAAFKAAAEAAAAGGDESGEDEQQQVM